MTNKKPDGYWQLYYQTRKAEGVNFNKQLKKLRKAIRKIVREHLGMAPDYIVTCVMVLLRKAMYRLSFRRLAAQFKSSPEMRKRCGLKYSPSKSTLHAMASKIATLGKGFMDKIVSATTIGADLSRLYGDSTGHGQRKYVDWRNAKYGNLLKRDFVKLHLIAAAGGPIMTFEVTGAHVHDSPVFRKMMANIPRGSGMIALDAAYDSEENCWLIADYGMVPVIMPRKNFVIRGYSPRAKMLRWYLERHDDFMESYKIRNLVESFYEGKNRRRCARQVPANTNSRAVCSSFVLQPEYSVRAILMDCSTSLP